MFLNIYLGIFSLNVFKVVWSVCECKLFPEDRFSMKYYGSYFKLDINLFLYSKGLVYYVGLMAICLASTIYFGILITFL